MKRLMVSITLILVFASICFSQTRSAPVPANPTVPIQTRGPSRVIVAPNQSDGGQSSLLKSFKGKILDLDDVMGKITIENPKGKKETFTISPVTHFLADKGTDLAGRKDLALSDFKVGQAVIVTYNPRDRFTTHLRLIREKK